MRVCPKCNSKKVHKEKWHEAVSNAFEIDAQGAMGDSGDMVCGDCGFSSYRTAFEKKKED